MYEIRQCELKDYQIVRDIGEKTYYDTFHSMNTVETMTKYLKTAFDSEKIKSELSNPDSFFYLVWHGEVPVAYLKINFGSAQTELQDDDAVEIERMYVLKEYKRLGIGKNMMHYALEQGRKHNCAYAWLGVWEKNISAINFYQHQGFEKVSTHIFKMGDEDQTDLIMKTNI
jgi:ribosomal protein S18 acetylase RimI-like enzyme